MKLEQYIRDLALLVKAHPEAKNMTVVYSCDDEGNSYTKAFYPPAIGYWDDHGFVADSKHNNAVCLN